MSKSILQEAQEIIYGDRERTYGEPGKNLHTIAKMWTAYIAGRSNQGAIRAEDVAYMMVLLKIARLANSPDHRDSLVDGCGYLALVERINASQIEVQEAHIKPE